MRKPDFDYHGLGTQFGPNPESALREIVAGLPDKPKILEVGSWVGTSACIMASEVKPRGGKVYCVDTFREGKANPYMWRTAPSTAETVLDRFLFNRDALGFGDTIFPLVMPSVEAAVVMGEWVFDMVFLDGDHRYDEVRKDIAHWITKVKPGGVLAGHDYECRMGDIPLDWENYHHDYVNPLTGEVDCFEAGHWKGVSLVHPGVIRAVDEAFGDGVSHRHTVWRVDV